MNREAKTVELAVGGMDGPWQTEEKMEFRNHKGTLD